MIQAARGSEQRETLRQMGLVFAATAFANAANFGLHFGAIRLLGLQTYSAFAALLAIVLILSVPANVVQAFITAVVGESIGKDPKSAGALNRAAIRVSLIVCACIAALGIAFAPLLQNYFGLPEIWPAYFAMLAIAFAFAVACLRGLLQGEQRFGALAASLMCEGGGNLVLGLTFVFAGGGLRGAIFGNVCGVAAAFLLCWAWARRGATAGRLQLNVRRVVSKAIGTAFGLGALAAMSWADVILVRHFMPPATAGLYGALAIVGRVLLFSIAFIPLVLIAKASKLNSQGRPTAPLLFMMLAAGSAVCLAELAMIRFMPGLILGAIAGKVALAATPYLMPYGLAIIALALTTIIVNYAIGIHRFAFVIPLLLIEAAEIGGITFFHASISQVISVLIAGHCLALASTVSVLALDKSLRRRHELRFAAMTASRAH